MTDEQLAHRFSLLETQLLQNRVSLETLISNVTASLGREIGDVKSIVERFAARLDKIAAGTHYVTRLAEWSETQDKFQAEILERMRAAEQRIRDLEKRNGK